jgi:hypothetical protein
MYEKYLHIFTLLDNFQPIVSHNLELGTRREFRHSQSIFVKPAREFYITCLAKTPKSIPKIDRENFSVRNAISN